MVGLGDIDEKEQRQKTLGNIEIWTYYYQQAKLTCDQIIEECMREDIVSYDQCDCDQKNYLFKKVIKKDSLKGRLVFIDTLKSFLGPLPSDEDAVCTAWQIYKNLHLSPLEIDEVIIDHIELDTHDSETGIETGPVLSEIVVMFTRNVNGLGVTSSQFRIRIGRGERLLKVVANWPTLHIPSTARAKSWAEIEADIKKRNLNIEDYNFFYMPHDTTSGRQFIPMIQIFTPGWTDDSGAEHSGDVILIDCAKLEGPDWCHGDLDSDGDVDGSDLAVFAADFGRTDCSPRIPCEGDFDLDGDVDGSDLAIFAKDFGRTDCPLPK